MRDEQICTELVVCMPFFRGLFKELPKGYTAIPCNKVLKEKHGPDGEITSYWVHIVAGGHKQVEGINYTETFFAATKMPTVHVVLGNAAEQDWEIEHINIKSADKPANSLPAYFRNSRDLSRSLGRTGAITRIRDILPMTHDLFRRCPILSDRYLDNVIYCPIKSRWLTFPLPHCRQDSIPQGANKF